MALHPIGDQCKIQVDKSIYNFGPEKPGTETGVVVEMPTLVWWIGFHSFAFEKSFGAATDIADMIADYNKLVGRRVVWESLQDRGRHFREGEDNFVLLKLSDIIGFTDSVDESVIPTDDDRSSAGSFNL